MPHSSWGGPGVSRGNLERLSRIPGIPLNVHKEVAIIFQHLIDEINKGGYRKPGSVPFSSSGGYVKRYISGTRIWSNHSWALAVDFNAATNPYKHGPLVTDFIPESIRPLARKLMLSWGGDWSGKKDAMHFEFIGSRADAARISREITIGLVNVTPPGIDPNSPLVRRGDKGMRVTEVQGILGIDNDGDFGPATEAAVQAFQQRNKLDPDGIVGPATWHVLRSGFRTPEAEPLVYRERMLASQTMHAGQMIAAGRYTFRLQGDGHLVLYDNSQPVWSSTVRMDSFHAQRDGRLVGYLKGKAVWGVGPFGRPLENDKYRLILQGDRNLVWYQDSIPLWATNTQVKS